ncbi:MAG TPA: ABC transporter permease [Acidimicrobiia bacterium]|nr:ABC transporter permease [Acidimicrobiia bacterium]
MPFIIAGLTTGAVYALAATGLVVTYTTSGVFNFAHGAVGLVAAVVFYVLRVDAGAPTLVAIAVAVLGLAPVVGVAIDRVFLGRLDRAGAAAQVVVPLGLLVALQGVVTAWFGAASRQVAPIFSTGTFALVGTRIGWDQVSVVAVATVAAAALGVFFRFSDLGLRMRAVVDDRELTLLTGIRARRVTSAAWVIGSAFAALSAILLVPFVGLDAAILTLLVVQAFGGAVVGRLTSIPLAFAGAMAIGLGASFATKLVIGHPGLAGLPTSLPFIVLFAVLVLSPRGSFGVVGRTGGSGRRPVRISRLSPPGMGALLAGTLALPLFVHGGRLLVATAFLAYVLLFVSLGLLVGLSRQLSLCHAVFLALGATLLAHLTDAGFPFPLALLVGGLAVVPLGVAIALPAIRLSGLFLALATFGFGILAQSLLFGTSIGFGATGTVSLDRPHIAGLSFAGDRAYYFLVLGVVAAGVAAVEVVARTRLGRLLRALADSPVAVESLGVNPVASRVLVFCLTAFLGALAGGLLGTLYRSINTTSFDFSASLLWVTVLVTTGSATLGGQVIAAALLALPAWFTASYLSEYQALAFGVAAILLAQSRNGLAGLWRRPDFGRLAGEGRVRLARSPVRERMAAVPGAGR